MHVLSNWVTVVMETLAHYVPVTMEKVKVDKLTKLNYIVDLALPPQNLDELTYYFSHIFSHNIAFA